MKEREETKTSSFGTNGRINHDSSKFYDSKLYKELNQVKNIEVIENDFPKNLINKIINSSSADMSSIPSGSVHLMITSHLTMFQKIMMRIYH